MTYVPISTALDRFAEPVRPTLRSLREDMVRRGCAVRYGRRIVTTSEWIERYFGELKPCASKPSVPNSSPSSAPVRVERRTGAREVLSRSGPQMAKLPMSDVSIALQAIQQRRGRRRSIA